MALRRASGVGHDPTDPTARSHHVRAARTVPERATALEVAGAPDRLLEDAPEGYPERRFEADENITARSLGEAALNRQARSGVRQALSWLGHSIMTR